MVTSPKYADHVWTGSLQQLTDGSKKLYKSMLQAANVPNSLICPPVPGSAGSKDALARIMEWVIEEHNHGRLPEGVITTGAKGAFPRSEDAVLVFPLQDYVENRDSIFGASGNEHCHYARTQEMHACAPRARGSAHAF